MYNTYQVPYPSPVSSSLGWSRIDAGCWWHGMAWFPSFLSSSSFLGLVYGLVQVVFRLEPEVWAGFRVRKGRGWVGATCVG